MQFALPSLARRSAGGDVPDDQDSLPVPPQGRSCTSAAGLPLHPDRRREPDVLVPVPGCSA